MEAFDNLFRHPIDKDIFEYLFGLMCNIYNAPFIKMVNDNPLATVCIIMAVGLIWIYFQIPNIKKKTAPPNGVVSSHNE